MNTDEKEQHGTLSRDFKETHTQTQITLEDVGGGRDHKADEGLSDEELVEGTVLVNPDVNSMDSRG